MADEQTPAPADPEGCGHLPATADDLAQMLRWLYAQGQGYHQISDLTRAGLAHADLRDFMAVPWQVQGSWLAERMAQAATPPLVAADLESRIADLENTIGQAAMMTESMLEGGQISLDCARRLLSTLGDDSARDAELFVCNREARDVHVDWHMTPEEWRELRAVLTGGLDPADSAYVQRLRAERIIAEEADHG
jgi:hypothetical protein